MGRSFFHFLRYFLGVDSAHTQTTASERDVLRGYAKGKKRVLEIGVYEGATTSLLAEQLADDGELFAVDPFISGRLGICWGKWIARREVQRIRSNKRIRFIEDYSHNANASIDGQFDFIFVDGDHSWDGITTDWHDWSGRIQPNGIIALHDTRVPNHNPGVADLGSFRYFEKHIREDPRFNVLEQVDSLSFLQRRPAAQAAPSNSRSQPN